MLGDEVVGKSCGKPECVHTEFVTGTSARLQEAPTSAGRCHGDADDRAEVTPGTLSPQGFESSPLAYNGEARTEGLFGEAVGTCTQAARDLTGQNTKEQSQPLILLEGKSL